MQPAGAGADLDADPNPARILELVPELQEVGTIEQRQICNRDSSDIGPEIWEQLAAEIAGALADYDGFVVIHGTDTMVYSAAALSYALRELPKPVVFTGSQRPMQALRSDARRNLISACMLATHPIPEVGLCFDDLLLRGNRAKKLSIADYRAFASPNYPPLAKIGLHVEVDRSRLRVPAGPFRLVSGFAPTAFHLKLFPGLNPKVAAAAAGPLLRGVILEAFGAGNLPILDPAWGELLREWRARGIVVAVVSPCPFGSVDMQLYAGGRSALDAGVVSAADMTAEAALVKLMHLLACYQDPQEVRERLSLDLAGELTGRAV
jgi:L-asparaginase